MLALFIYSVECYTCMNGIRLMCENCPSFRMGVQSMCRETGYCRFVSMGRGIGWTGRGKGQDNCQLADHWQRCQSVKLKKTVSGQENWNIIQFCQIGLKMCKLPLAKKKEFRFKTETWHLCIDELLSSFLFKGNSKLCYGCIDNNGRCVHIPNRVLRIKTGFGREGGTQGTERRRGMGKGRTSVNCHVSKIIYCYVSDRKIDV